MRKVAAPGKEEELFASQATYRLQKHFFCLNYIALRNSCFPRASRLHAIFSLGCSASGYSLSESTRSLSWYSPFRDRSWCFWMWASRVPLSL